MQTYLYISCIVSAQPTCHFYLNKLCVFLWMILDQRVYHKSQKDNKNWTESDTDDQNGLR